MRKARQYLNYVTFYEKATLRYSASDMMLTAHSDASYLSKPNARSRAGGHFFLSKDIDNPPNNGVILNIAQIIKNVMTLATKAKLGALYIATKECKQIGLILKEMGHKHPQTSVQTDSSTIEGVINSKLQPKQTKAMDMQFHWLSTLPTISPSTIQLKPSKACEWSSSQHNEHLTTLERENLHL